MHGSEKSSQEAMLFYIYIFVLFRFFDIKKPFPINIFDKNYKNSFGVIIDDVIAGFYVVLTLIVFMIIKSKVFHMSLNKKIVSILKKKKLKIAIAESCTGGIALRFNHFCKWRF